MKLWLVRRVEPYDVYKLVGIYDTLGKAAACVGDQLTGGSPGEYEIKEVTLNEVIT